MPRMWIYFTRYTKYAYGFYKNARRYQTVTQINMSLYRISSKKFRNKKVAGLQHAVSRFSLIITQYSCPSHYHITQSYIHRMLKAGRYSKLNALLQAFLANGTWSLVVSDNSASPSACNVMLILHKIQVISTRVLASRKAQRQGSVHQRGVITVSRCTNEHNILA